MPVICCVHLVCSHTIEGAVSCFSHKCTTARKRDKLSAIHVSAAALPVTSRSACNCRALCTDCCSPPQVRGVDYTFLTLSEFRELERSGNLLESGVYEGTAGRREGRQDHR